MFALLANTTRAYYISRALIANRVASVTCATA